MKSIWVLLQNRTKFVISSYVGIRVRALCEIALEKVTFTSEGYGLHFSTQHQVEFMALPSSAVSLFTQVDGEIRRIHVLRGKNVLINILNEVEVAIPFEKRVKTNANILINEWNGTGELAKVMSVLDYTRSFFSSFATRFSQIFSVVI